MVNSSAANADIRSEIRKSGIMMWEIASKLGIHHCTFSVWLRSEMSDELKGQIRAIIAELTEENA
jgi:lambda repressor-like predicted transcriptional regulator